MSTERYDELFAGYLGGEMNDEERTSFERRLEEDAAFLASFEEFRDQLEIERFAQKQEFEISPYFESRVMQAIDKSESSSLWSLFRQLTKPSKLSYGAVGTFAVLLIAVQLGRQQSLQDISLEKSLAVKTEAAAVKPNRAQEELPKLSEEMDSSASEPMDQAAATIGKLESPSDLDKSQIPQKATQDKGQVNLPPKAVVKSKAAMLSKKRTLSSPLAAAVEDIEGGSQEFAAEVTVNDLLSGGSRKSRRKPGSGRIRFQDASGNTIERTMSFESAPVAPVPGLPQNYGRVLDSLQAPSREQYLHSTENGRVQVSSEPVSTFSVDVDTGSYTNVRRYLQMGQLPPSSAVRIEEFLNYFDYDYPSETEKPFGLSYEIAPAPFSEERHFLKLGIQAKKAQFEQKAWNLVFLIDVSGSMSAPNKLGLVKGALRVLVSKMRENDRISIVTYAGYSGVALEQAGLSSKQKILDVIDALGAGGSTNGAAGIETAYRLAERAFISDGVNRIILATDGDFNVGTSNRNSLVSLIESKRPTGVTLTTVGVGSGNLNEAMMEQISNKGNGNYFYLDSMAEARKVFSQQLVGTLEVVAKDVKLQIEFNPEQVEEYRLIGYENRKLQNQDFANDAVDAGEIGAGHRVTALYELKLKSAALSPKTFRYKANASSKTALPKSSSELGFLKARFKEPQGTTSKLLEFPIEADKVQDSFGEASNDFRFAAAVSAFGHLLRQSRFAAGTFKEVFEIAVAAKGEDSGGYRQEFARLVLNASNSRR